MALEKLPATFNLQELHKGFFAYSWIREDKYEYVGPYPPAEDYHPERMSDKTLRSVHFGVVVLELINCKCGGIVRNQIW